MRGRTMLAVGAAIALAMALSGAPVVAAAEDDPGAAEGGETDEALALMVLGYLGKHGYLMAAREMIAKMPAEWLPAEYEHLSESNPGPIGSSMDLGGDGSSSGSGSGSSGGSSSASCSGADSSPFSMHVSEALLLTETSLARFRKELDDSSRLRFDVVVKETKKWEERNEGCREGYREAVIGLRNANQGMAYKWAAMGNDEMAEKHHIVTLQSQRTAWLMDEEDQIAGRESAGLAALKKGKTDTGSTFTTGDQWWKDPYALTAMQAILATQAMGEIFARKNDAAAKAAVDHAAGVAAANAAQIKTYPLFMESSGFPIYKYQQDALDALIPMAPGRGITRVDADISVKDFYEQFVALGKPVLVKRGTLEGWAARKNWRREALLADEARANVWCKVKRGPSPDGRGYQGPGDRHNVDSDVEKEDELGADGEELEETTEAEIQARWDRFMDSMAAKAEDGWVYDEAENVLRNEEGVTISIMPPPKPNATPKPGAKTSLGKAKEMRLHEYINDIVAPETPSPDLNVSHPENRYVFNTFLDNPLGDDFAIPDLIANISTVGEYADGFTDAAHGPGKFEFFFGAAGTGAYLHAHAAAWNGLAFGRKRWVIVTPGKLQDTSDLPGGEVPAYEWFRDSYPIWREKFEDHLIEFTQEEGEMVFIPDNWGHAIMNLEPCIGVSKQLGKFTYNTGVPSAITDLL